MSSLSRLSIRLPNSYPLVSLLALGTLTVVKIINGHGPSTIRTFRHATFLPNSRLCYAFACPGVDWLSLILLRPRTVMGFLQLRQMLVARYRMFSMHFSQK